jgi:hypothetical protein
MDPMTTNSHWFNVANPLTDHLPKVPRLEDVVQLMTNDPLNGLDVSKLSFLEQDELLVMEKMPLRPTIQSMRTGFTIRGMTTGSLRLRNPTSPEGRTLVDKLIDVGQSEGLKYFSAPQPGSSTLLILGGTGTSKTVTVKQALKLLGPQVIRHQPNEAALWLASTQLVYLFVGMSHDGSRGGLLTGILLAIDRALQTNYAIDMPKKFKTIERLSGAVISLMHSLHLGVLIVDECQLRNLVTSDQADLMQLFLLNLMNSGIPLVLVGNPFAFTWMADLSQDARRLTERPPEFFHPCGAMGTTDEDDWDDVFDGVSSYYVLHSPVQKKKECSSILKQCSGGVPGLALSLWCTAQRLVLHEQERSHLLPEDITAAYADKGFDTMRDLADGFANKDPIRMLRWRDEDVPVDYYAAAWGRPLPDVIPENTESSAPARVLVEPRVATKRRAPSAASKLQAQKTREANQNLKRIELDPKLQEEDMRKNGLTRHALDSFNAMMANIDGSHPKPDTPSSGVDKPKVREGPQVRAKE